jgi:hypothetical protein
MRVAARGRREVWRDRGPIGGGKGSVNDRVLKVLRRRRSSSHFVHASGRPGSISAKPVRLIALMGHGLYKVRGYRSPRREA